MITLKEFRSQLLAEELIVENNIGSNPTYLAAMNTVTKPHVSRGQQDYNSFDNGGYRSFNRNRGRGRYNSGQRGFYNSGQRGFFPRAPMNVRPAVAPNTPSGGMSAFPSGGMGSHISAASGAFSPIFSNGPYNPSPGFSMLICQLCNKEGHSATACGFRGYERTRCNLCGKPNHTTWYCYYNASGPNFMGHGNSYETNASLPNQHQAMYTIQNPFSPLPQPSPQAVPPVWITDSGATNHMTPDLSNLTASTSYPTNDSVQTANGEGLPVSHIGNAIISTPTQALKLNSVLCVPKLSQNLLSVYQMCVDNNCRVIFDAFCFWVQDKVTGRLLYKGLCCNGLYPLPSFPSQNALSSLGFQA